jgi:hypothetical protein
VVAPPSYYPPVTRDYAALLAQVVPVVALALGFEIRSMAERIRTTDEKPVPPWRRSLLLYLCTTLLVLAFVEVRALAVVAGDAFIRSWTYIFVLAIVVAFMAPTFDALSEASPIKRGDIRSLGDPQKRPEILTTLAAVIVMLFSLIAVLGTIFQ